MNSKVYKWCAVPQCINTSIKTPNKVFVSVPRKKIIKDKWLKLARRNPNDVWKIKNNPRSYIGIPLSCYYLVNLIQQHANIPPIHILLCLKKIKVTAYSFA